MKYSELSDFEINKRVAKLTGNYGSCEPAFNAVYRSSGTQYDPVNRPEQAWPIIAANKINIEWGENTATDLMGRVSANCCHLGDKVLAFDVDTEDHSPFRAAMVVYLMMQEQQHDR